MKHVVRIVRIPASVTIMTDAEIFLEYSPYVPDFLHVIIRIGIMSISKAYPRQSPMILAMSVNTTSTFLRKQGCLITSLLAAKARVLVNYRF